MRCTVRRVDRPATDLLSGYLPTKIKPPATIASIPNKTLIVGLPTDRACIIPVIMSQMPSNRNPVLLINLTLISLTSLLPILDTKSYRGLVIYLNCLGAILLSINFDTVLLQFGVHGGVVDLQ